jgi:hypothetical protein
MPLVTCPDCGKQVSTNSAFCLQCGYEPYGPNGLKAMSDSLRTIKGILIFYLVLTLIGMFIGGFLIVSLINRVGRGF